MPEQTSRINSKRAESPHVSPKLNAVKEWEGRYAAFPVLGSAALIMTGATARMVLRVYRIKLSDSVSTVAFPAVQPTSRAPGSFHRFGLELTA